MKRKTKNLNPDSLMMTQSKLSFAEGTKAYVNLRKQVDELGILERTYGYYLGLTLFLIVGYLLCVYLLILSQTFWLVGLCSVAFAFFLVQFGGLIHDAGHRAIFNTSKYNDWMGEFAAVFTVFAYTEWRLTHNRHHAHTNEQGEDPDLDIIFHAFSVEQLFKLKGIGRVLTKYQHWIFYPLRSLMFITTRVDSFSYFVKSFRKQTLIGKMKVMGPFLLFLVGAFLLFVAPFIVFPLWKALTFFLVTNFVQGIYASNIFASNHKAMPQVPKGMKLSFMEQQIETSRNVKPGRFTDFVCLCLNYQIEHHLFPNCPRPHIKRLAPLVMKLCRKEGLEYTTDTVFETHRIIVAQLKHVETLIA